MSILDEVKAHLPAARQRVIPPHDDTKLLQQIADTFRTVADEYGLTLTYTPPHDGPWGYRLIKEGHEVARACTHSGLISWSVTPFGDPPAEPYTVSGLHWRSHHCDFHRFGEALALPLAQLETMK